MSTIERSEVDELRSEVRRLQHRLQRLEGRQDASPDPSTIAPWLVAPLLLALVGTCLPWAEEGGNAWALGDDANGHWAVAALVASAVAVTAFLSAPSRWKAAPVAVLGAVLGFECVRAAGSLAESGDVSGAGVYLVGWAAVVLSGVAWPPSTAGAARADRWWRRGTPCPTRHRSRPWRRGAPPSSARPGRARPAGRPTPRGPGRVPTRRWRG